MTTGSFQSAMYVAQNWDASETLVTWRPAHTCSQLPVIGRLPPTVDVIH